MSGAMPLGGATVAPVLAEPFRIAIVGPLPPPSGGMANQCRQLATLLEREGLAVEVVQTNAPYRPAWIGRIRFVRALFRLLPYSFALWRAARRSDLMHLLANSGWAWHLLAAPAVWIARLHRTPIIVNFRGGNADAFLSHAPAWVAATMRRAQRLVVPSAFLKEVFARHGLDAEIVSNVIDLDRFCPRTRRRGTSPCILVARNLESIYGISTALQAFALVLARHPGARLVVAGSGPDRAMLERLAVELGVAQNVTFAGRVDNARMPELYRDADIALNPSTVDNMPISLLEAFASGVPVVSTSVGGVPFIARDGATALLVPVGDAAAMAAALVRLLEDEALYERLRQLASTEVRQYAWPAVRERLFACYASCASRRSRVAS